MEIYLYEHPNFAGRQVQLTDADPNLDNVHFGNKTSSIVVKSGKWQLFDRPNYGEGGAGSVRLSPGEYPDAKSIGLPNNSISSLRPFPSLALNAGDQIEPDLTAIFQGPETADLYIISKDFSVTIGKGNYTSFSANDVGISGKLSYDKHGINLYGQFTVEIKIIDIDTCNLIFQNESMGIHFNDTFPYECHEPNAFKVLFNNYQQGGYTYNGSLDFEHSDHKCGGAKITPDIEVEPGEEKFFHGVVIRPCE